MSTFEDGFYEELEKIAVTRYDLLEQPLAEMSPEEQELAQAAARSRMQQGGDEGLFLGGALGSLVPFGTIPGALIGRHIGKGRARSKLVQQGVDPSMIPQSSLLPA